jgi:hypothetical protein
LVQEQKTLLGLLDLLSPEWFLPKAAIGLAVGFTFRILEHFAFHRREGNTNQKLFLFSIVVLMQSICVGVPLAYILLAILAYNLPSPTFITVAAYMLPLFTGFLAFDLRDLLRRIT